METKSDERKQDINWKLHEAFIKRCFDMLPSAYSSQDPNRLTLAYFVISAHDLLGLREKIPPKEVIDWIYSLQILPDVNDPSKNKKNCGWRGATFLGLPFDCSCQRRESNPHDQGHIAMTYVALALLLILGDDFSRVDKKAIVEAMLYLQQPSGSFSPCSGGSESDIRYIYCATCVCYMLNDWSGFDKDKAVQYIVSAQSYDCAIAQGPFEESHGGSTYCALAALSLMGRLHDLPYKDKLIHWLISRQSIGFNGRPNKLEDTCYSFWVGASLSLLGHYDLVIEKYTRSFTIGCQRKIGGFAKWPDYDQPPDVLHTYFSFCGLSFNGEIGVSKVHPGLGFSQRAHDRLFEIHKDFIPMKIDIC